MALCTNIAPPRVILLLRHAEKPTDNKDPNLSPKGYSRAGALPAWLINTYGRPIAVYAMKSGDAGADSIKRDRFLGYTATYSGSPQTPQEHKTHRPVQTVTPLAQALGQTVLSPYGYGQTNQIVNEILTTPAYSGKLVVLCWVHGEIKSLAQQFGYTQAKDWDGNDFDHVWAITMGTTPNNNNNTMRYILKDTPTTMEIVPQRLLFGDASK